MKRSGKWSYLLATLLVIVFAILVGYTTENLGEDMVLESPLNKYVSIDRQFELLGLVQFAFAFVIPAIFFVLARRWIGTGPALLLVVSSVWIARHAFRMAIGLTICIAHANTLGDSDYDGVGGNVFSLVFGWVEPLLTCLLIIAVGAVCRRFRRSSSPILSAASEDA